MITAVTPVLPAVSDTATFHYVPVAARIIAVSGDAQSGLIGTAFGLPLIVEVQDAGGAPYRGGYPVTFGVASGPTGTSVAPTTVNTDLTGRAQTVLTAGSARRDPLGDCDCDGSDRLAADLQRHGDDRWPRSTDHRRGRRRQQSERRRSTRSWEPIPRS